MHLARDFCRPANWAGVLFVLSVLPLAACGEAVGGRAVALDHVADPAPFPKPALNAQLTLPGAGVLPEASRQTLTLRRAFFAGDFAWVETALMASHKDYLSGAGSNTVATRLISSIQDTELAGIDACASWLRASPNSYAAHWVCGAIWENGAWVARGKKFANEVGDARFALMHERLQQSGALLERAITLTPKPIEALTLLGKVYYLDGERDKAEGFLQRAETILPQHKPLYDVRMNFSLPEWGGSEAQVKAIYDRAKAAGVKPVQLLDMYDAYIARPEKLTNPGAARDFWAQAVGEHATHQRLTSLLGHHYRVSNWREALPVATRLLTEHPHDASAFYWRAHIHEKLGLLEKARADYTTAAAMGHELALQSLIMAHLRGGLGISGRSFETIHTLCRYGATLGSGVGANCIGSLYGEGGNAGVPHPRDAGQELAWHEVGARAGHYNSQYDLGWLLFTNRGAGMDAGKAKELGIFWLRRAAEQNHVYAKRKLEEHGIGLSEEPNALPRGGAGVHAFLTWLGESLGSLFRQG